MTLTTRSSVIHCISPSWTITLKRMLRTISAVRASTASGAMSSTVRLRWRASSAAFLSHQRSAARPP